MPKRKSMGEHLIKSATKGAARGCGRGCVLFITPFLVLVLIFSFGCALSGSFREGFERGWEGEEQTIEEISEVSARESIEAEVVENVAFEEIIEEGLVEEETAEENPVDAPDIEYEEIGMQGLFVFIYTTATKRAELQQIVGIYKNDKFKSKRIFELDFFNNREKALVAKTNFGMMLPDAIYNYNANIGLSELILYQDD